MDHQNDSRISVRSFPSRDASSQQGEIDLSSESRAALRQFAVERLMGYGVAFEDAVQLRDRVAHGEPWRDAAVAIAETILSTIDLNATRQSRTNVLYGASAMYRTAQVMMTDDTEDRATLFACAADLFEEASAISRRCKRVIFETTHGKIVGWRFCPSASPIGVAVVLGGIEGWAMDFADLSTWLVDRNLEVWAIDGPGQGESRFTFGHYLHSAWRDVYKQVLDEITRGSDLPLALVGNSVGATIALELAAFYDGVHACCANGGPPDGATMLGQEGSKLRKKRLMCGPETDPRVTDATWKGIDLLAAVPAIRCSVLLVHGGRDPLITDAEMRAVFNGIASSDKQLVVFSDGDHCIYNHPNDKNVLMADWVVGRIRALAGGSGVASESLSRQFHNA